MTVLNYVLDIDRKEQFWNAANVQKKAAAGKELLAKVTKLDVFAEYLSGAGNETMNLSWDLFNAKVEQGIISLLKPIHNMRNDLLSGIDKEFSIGNDQIDEMLKDKLTDDFVTILPLSDFLHTPSDMRHDTDSLYEQRKTYVEMLIKLSGNEYRDSTGSNDVTSLSKGYGSETMKNKEEIDEDLEKHSSKGKGRGKTFTVTPAPSRRQNPSSSSNIKDKATTENISKIQSQLKTFTENRINIMENRDANKENKANAKDIKESKINAVKDLAEESCYVNPTHCNEWATFYLQNWGKELLSEEIKLKYINRLRPLAAEGMKKLFQLN